MILTFRYIGETEYLISNERSEAKKMTKLGTIGISRSWSGRHINVEILFSCAGLAQQIWIEANDRAILIDCGDGTLRDIIAKRFDLKKLDAIFFTHGHFDHMGGLHTLLGFLRMIQRDRPLPIYIPDGCTEIIASVESFKSCYTTSIPFEIELIENETDHDYALHDITVTPFETIHSGCLAGGIILDRIPSHGYRIRCKNETIAISGDTGDCDSLRKNMVDVDLAVIEATYTSSKNQSKEELTRVHLSQELAVQIGSLTKEYILVHKRRMDEK